MNWKPDKDNIEPIYKQISRFIEEQIFDGSLSPGEKLPSERKLATELEVNRSTISEAYGELYADGIVTRVKGSGTLVNDSLWGMSPLRIPNWNQYNQSGSFLPSEPLHKMIHKASENPNILNLARGEMGHDLIPTFSIQSAMQHTVIDGLSYGDANGDFSLRESISTLYAHDQGVKVSTDNVLITSGGQQAFHLIAQCLLQPGDGIAIESPSYLYSLRLFTSAGIRLYPIPVDHDGLIPEKIEELYYKNKIRMVFTNPTFQNPTGTVLSEARRRKLVRVCQKLRIPLIEDDPYRELHFNDSYQLPQSLLSLTRKAHSIIHIGSVSKTIAPGFRIGWLIGPSSIIERLADAKKQMDLGTSMLTQKIMATYLLSDDNKLNKTKLIEMLTSRRNAMIQALNQYLKGRAEWENPEGGYFVWLHVATNLTDKELVEKGIKKGLLLFPGSLYGAEKGYIRLNFALVNEIQIKKGIFLLSKVLEES